MTACIHISSAFIWLSAVTLLAADEVYRPVAVTPPEPPREFRGAWITEVASNQDWPSKPGVPAAQMQAELIALLDRAAQLKLNAVIFQVRPACDAIYASPLEPWSAYLTGRMGQPPQPAFIRWRLLLPRRTSAGWNCTPGSIHFARCCRRIKLLSP